MVKGLFGMFQGYAGNFLDTLRPGGTTTLEVDGGAVNPSLVVGGECW